MDVTALATLQAQLRQIVAIVQRLGRARLDLVPAAATFWAGPARQAYDGAVLDLDAEIGSALEVLGFAEQNTRLAIAEELGRA